MKSADPLVLFDRPIREVIGIGMFLPLFCVVYLETRNDLMTAGGELIMLKGLLIMPGVEHAMLNIIKGQFVVASAEAQGWILKTYNGSLS